MSDRNLRSRRAPASQASSGPGLAAAAPAAPVAPAPAAPVAPVVPAPAALGSSRRNPWRGDDPDLDLDLDSGEDGDEDIIKSKGDNKVDEIVGIFKDLSEEVKNAVIKAIKHVAIESKRARERLPIERPVPEPEDVLTYIPPNPQDWTDDEEAEVQQQWENSLEREALAVGTKPFMVTLWGNWVRLFQTAPSCFISVRNCLQYHTKLADGVTPSPNWDHKFCDRLRKLSCHAVFYGRIELLHLALLWVPICQQDYRGTIQWHNPTSDTLLTNLIQAMADQDGSLTIVEVHKQVRDAYGPKGPCSFMSDLLLGIEKRAFQKKAANEPIFRPRVLEPFDISANDLKTVKRAANAIKVIAMPAFHPMAVSSRVIATAKKDYGYPRKEHVPSLREKAALSVLRFKMRRDQAIAEFLNRSPTPSDSGSDESDPVASAGNDDSDPFGDLPGGDLPMRDLTDPGDLPMGEDFPMGEDHI